MAKVRFDLDEATTKRKAERLAAYLRIRMAANHLQGRIGRILERAKTEAEEMEEPALVLKIPPAIDETEAGLHLFNRDDSYRFYYVKAALINVGEMIESEDSWQKTTNFKTGKSRRTLKPDVLQRYKTEAQYISESASLLDQELMTRCEKLYEELDPPITWWRRFREWLSEWSRRSRSFLVRIFRACDARVAQWSRWRDAAVDALSSRTSAYWAAITGRFRGG